MMPTFLAMASAVMGWSPVTIMTRTPASLHLATASGTEGRGGSMRVTKPKNRKPSVGKFGFGSVSKLKSLLNWLGMCFTSHDFLRCHGRFLMIFLIFSNHTVEGTFRCDPPVLGSWRCTYICVDTYAYIYWCICVCIYTYMGWNPINTCPTITAKRSNDCQI